MNAKKGRGRTANKEAEPTTTEEPRGNPGVINPELGAEISWWYREFHIEIDQLSEDNEVFIYKNRPATSNLQYYNRHREPRRAMPDYCVYFPFISHFFNITHLQMIKNCYIKSHNPPLVHHQPHMPVICKQLYKKIYSVINLINLGGHNTTWACVTRGLLKVNNT